jgi:protein-tyrosine phosphatase
MWLAGCVNASGQVGWDGAVNAWLVAGSVYRMGRREWVTEAGWKKAYGAGIRTIIDLRNLAERQPRPSDPDVGGALAAFDVVHVPTEDPDNLEFKALCDPYLNDPAHYAANARLFPDRLAAVFKAVAASSGGVVIHCSAGRDRSGMIAAMLQDLAGAGDSEIVASYQAAMRGINERHRTMWPPHPHERYLDEETLAPLLESRGARVLGFVRQLNTREFLLQNGVTEPELESVLAALGARVAL